MKKLMTLLVVSIGFTYFTLARTTTEKTSVLFNTAKHQLTNNSEKELSAFIGSKLKLKDYQITIKGHTDNIGSINYNKNLSFKRAQEVKDYLVKLGINPTLIQIEYLGELSPKKPNVNDYNRQENRRVEVILNIYSFDNIEELEQALSPKQKSTHVISPNKENLIMGNKGVKVFIQENSFVYEDGTSVKEKVKVVLTESLNFKDFIASGLLTQSDDKLIESGGMIKLEAKTVTGKPVKLKKENPMTIAIPTDKRKENMELFSSNTGKNWKAKNQPIRKNLNLNIKVPKRPLIKLPVFVYDKSTKPKAPYKPRAPKNPHIPRADSYIKHIPWYKFNKEKIRTKQEFNYKRAVELYIRRVDKYEARMVKHKEKMAIYNEKFMDYNNELLCWRENIEKERELFYSSDEYQKKLEIYNAIIEQRKEDKRKAYAAAGEQMDKMGVASADMLNNYVFTFNEMNWINVDRFYHMDASQKQLITLKGEKNGNERVLILFKNINSMLSMQFNKEVKGYQQENFPKKEAAVIFAYKVKKGKPMLCYKEIDGSSNYNLKFVNSSFAEIKTILEQFKGPKAS